MTIGADARLEQFRAEWPGHVSWSEVRAEDPGAFRMAARGGWLILAAACTTPLASSLIMEFPLAIPLPGWIDWLRPLLLIVALWGSIMLWIGGLIMVTMPGDARRAIAIRRFAEERGLNFSRFGLAPPRLGIFFAGSQLAPLPKRLRPGFGRAAGHNDGAQPLFQAQFALWQGYDASAPELQLAVASYTGSKSDPKGPRHAFRYLTVPLSRDLPHLMVDSLRNGSLRSLLPGTERMRLEGDFDRYFAVYAPSGYERDALELLTPDVMACLIDYGRHWDVEVVEDRLIVASAKVRGRSDRDEITALLRFSELFGAELGHQAMHYSDPRSHRPRSQVAPAGRRLKLRSAAWGIAIFAIVTVALLVFPHVLGWLLDVRH